MYRFGRISTIIISHCKVIQHRADVLDDVHQDKLCTEYTTTQILPFFRTALKQGVPASITKFIRAGKCPDFAGVQLCRTAPLL